MSRSSRSSPRSRRSRNSAVLSFSEPLLSFSSSGSQAPMSGARLAKARSFLPSPARRRRSSAPTVSGGYRRWTPPDRRSGGDEEARTDGGLSRLGVADSPAAGQQVADLVAGG